VSVCAASFFAAQLCIKCTRKSSIITSTTPAKKHAVVSNEDGCSPAPQPESGSEQRRSWNANLLLLKISTKDTSERKETISSSQGLTDKPYRASRPRKAPALRPEPACWSWR